MIITSRLSRFFSVLLAAVIQLNFAQIAFAYSTADPPTQTSEQSKVRGIYSSIPESLRDSFIERLTLFLRYRSEKNWTAFYDLLLERNIRNRTRAQFVQDYRRSSGVAGTGHAFLSFSPKRIELSTTEQVWTIYGCAKIEGIKFKVDAFIVASQETGEWHFSDIDMLTPRDTPFRKCSYHAKSRKAAKHWLVGPTTN